MELSPQRESKSRKELITKIAIGSHDDFVSVDTRCVERGLPPPLSQSLTIHYSFHFFSIHYFAASLNYYILSLSPQSIAARSSGLQHPSTMKILIGILVLAELASSHDSWAANVRRKNSQCASQALGSAEAENILC